MLIPRALLLIAATLTAAPAQALTCFRPTVADSYAFAAAREEPFVVALGALSRAGPDIPDGPETGDPNRRVGYSFAARFEGLFASATGMARGADVPVTVEVSCISAWCGFESLSDDGLYFLRRDAGEAGPTYTLEAGPCPLNYYDAPAGQLLVELLPRLD